MKRTLTAASENEVQATIEYTFRNMGACCWGYPSIVASGPNATTLHYERNDAPIARNGLMLTNVGAEVDGYTADVTRTYPANGKFSDDQRAIYSAEPGHDAPRHSLEADERQSRRSPRTRAAQTRPDLEERSAPGALVPISHHIGLDVHDVTEPGFAEGMVVTKEPGI